MIDSQVETMITGTDAAHTTLEQSSWEPLHYGDDNQGRFADATRPRITAYNDLAVRGSELAAERKSILEDLETANAKFAAAPTPAEVKAAYDAYEKSFYSDDSTEETNRLQDEYLRLKKEREEALAEHTAAVEDIARRNTEWVEAMTELQEMLRNAGVLPDEDKDDKDDDWRDGQDKDGKPKGEDGKPDSTPARTLDDVIDGGGDSTPTGQTQLSSDAVPVQAQQSGYPTIYPTAQQQPMTTAASPSPSITPAFNSALNPSPSRAQRDKDKEKERKRAERDTVLPVPSPVATPVPIDRGTSTNGVTTKDISGKPSPPTALTNAAPGAANQTAGGRGGVGGGMVGGGMPGGHGGSIGAGNKTTTAQKILDSDRTLSRRPDDDPSVSGGNLSKDNLTSAQKDEQDADDEILRRNAAGEQKKKDDKR